MKMAGMVQEEDERHVEVEDAFERCALHALADFHSLYSASVDVSTGRSVRLRCSRGRLSSTATCNAEDSFGTAVADASDSLAGGALPQPAMQSPGQIQSDRRQEGSTHGNTEEASGDAVAVDRQEKKEVDDRPIAGLRAGGEPSSVGAEPSGSQLPFTAVDVVAVLQEERQAQAALGRHVDGSLTVAALTAHRQEQESW